MDLTDILQKHSLWVSGKPGGIRANLRGANLRGANLRGANLRGADLRGASLRGASLRDADLWGADLEGADLEGADLEGANLRYASLRGASLRDADLWDADLRDADLRGANLRDADLRYANLRGASLRDANLRGANLEGADLEGAKLPDFQICPEEGSFVAWKKVSGGVLKLLIPAEAKRTSSLVGRKCRAEFVVVLEGSGKSMHDPHKSYKKGDAVYPDKYDDDIRVECTNGIHFFMTRKEAEEY